MNKRLPIQLATGLIIIIALIVGGAFYFMGKGNSMKIELIELDGYKSKVAIPMNDTGFIRYVAKYSVKGNDRSYYLKYTIYDVDQDDGKINDLMKKLKSENEEMDICGLKGGFGYDLGAYEASKFIEGNMIYTDGDYFYWLNSDSVFRNSLSADESEKSKNKAKEKMKKDMIKLANLYCKN